MDKQAQSQSFFRVRTNIWRIGSNTELSAVFERYGHMVDSDHIYGLSFEEFEGRFLAGARAMTQTRHGSADLRADRL